MPDTEQRVTRARLRYLQTSPPKARVVLELIRGQDVDTARETLRFCDRAAANEIGKLLDSAIANAEHNDNIPEDELFVAGAHADEGPALKRWRPRARGRGVRVRKRTSHITIELSRIAEEDREARRRAEAAVGRARRTLRRRPRRQPVEDVEAAEEDEALEEATAVEPEPDQSEDTEAGAPAQTPAKKRAPAKRATKATGAAKTPAKKTTAKKAAPTKAKKTTAKKQADAPAKKAAPRKRSKPKDED